MDGAAISLNIFATTPSHLFQTRHLDILSNTAVSPMADKFVSGIFLSKYRQFNFLASLIVFEGEKVEFCTMCCSTRRP